MTVTQKEVEAYVTAALRIYPEVVETVKAKIAELGKADAVSPEEVVALMSQLIVEAVKQRGEELQRAGLDAVDFLGFAHAHKAELEVFLVGHPEYRAPLGNFLNPFSLPPQPHAQ